MKLRLLIILRHGEPGPGDFLTQTAREEMIALGVKLRAEHGLIARNTAVLCSKRLRALKTAQAICRGAWLNMQLREICRDEFFSSSGNCDVEKALSVIDEFGKEYEVLIIATHAELMAVLPTAFGNRFNIPVPQDFLQYGQGYVINLREQNCQRVA